MFCVATVLRPRFKALLLCPWFGVFRGILCGPGDLGVQSFNPILLLSPPRHARSVVWRRRLGLLAVTWGKFRTKILFGGSLVESKARPALGGLQN